MVFFARIFVLRGLSGCSVQGVRFAGNPCAAFDPNKNYSFVNWKHILLNLTAFLGDIEVGFKGVFGR